MNDPAADERSLQDRSEAIVEAALLQHRARQLLIAATQTGDRPDLARRKPKDQRPDQSIRVYLPHALEGARGGGSLQHERLGEKLAESAANRYRTGAGHVSSLLGRNFEVARVPRTCNSAAKKERALRAQVIEMIQQFATRGR